MNTDTLGPQRSDRIRPIPSSGDAGTMTGRSRPQQAQFRVDGIASASEAAHLEHRLIRQVGVIGVSVNTITDFAYIAYDPALTSPTVLQRQIEVSGFGAWPR
jgi:hypothetical protein